MTRGFPQGQAVQVFPSPRWLRAFFSPHSSGFPLCQLAQSFPFAGGSGVAPLAGWHRALPWPEASELPFAGWPGVSPAPGGSEFPPRLVAPGSSLPEGPDLPVAGWLGVSPLPVARGFPSAGYRPGGRRISTPIAGDRTRGFGQQFQDSLAVHKPSTVGPRLSPATGLSPPNTPQDGPQGGCLPGGGPASGVPVSPAPGSGRQI